MTERDSDVRTVNQTFYGMNDFITSTVNLVETYPKVKKVNCKLLRRAKC